MNKKQIKVIAIGMASLIFPVAVWFFSTGLQDRQLNAVSVYLNGSALKIDTIYDNGNIYVPIDEICYYLKCGYEKNDAQKTINFIKHVKTLNKPKSIDNAGSIKKTAVKINNSGYKTMIDGLLLYIDPVVYNNNLFINLKYLAQSFEMDSRWGFLKKSLKLEHYPVEYAGVVNGEKIKRRFFNERYGAKLILLKETAKEQRKRISGDQKKQMEMEAFKETVDLILASQIAREYGITIDDEARKTINWYLQATVNKFGGIDELRNWVGKYGVTYQDGINYFTYGVLREKLKVKAAESVRPSEVQMWEYYVANKGSFIHPAEAIVQHIIIPTKDKDENSYSEEKVEEQRNLANKVLGLLKAGGDFEALRKKYSIDYFADTANKPGGFTVVKGSLSIAQVLEDAVFALKPGQISDVVKTYRGFHIIRLIGKTDETVKSFEEAKEEIAKDLDYTVKTAYFNGLMQTRKEKSVIERLF